MKDLFALERVKIIKNYLNKESKVSVAKLSELLNVSEVTIRRDLEKLEEEGFLQRTHGGAVLKDHKETDIMEPEDDPYLEQRIEIANTASLIVSDSETIMLTDGLTNIQIAKKLATKNNLTVLTNDVRIAFEFSNSPNNKLILLGGDLDEFAVFGQLSINNIKNFSFNHLFMEVDGICKKTGMTVSSISKASLLQEAIKAADIVSVVCLADFFGEKSFYRVENVTVADKIITNSTLNDSYKDFLFDLNIQLFTSVDIYET